MSSDGEKGKKGVASGRSSPHVLPPPTPLTLDPNAPVATDDRAMRSLSPGLLPTALVLKMKTQMSRVASVKSILESLPTSHTETSADEISAMLTQIDTLHKAFIKEHAHFETTWPAALIDHHYFATDVHQSMTNLVVTAHLQLCKLKAKIPSSQFQVSASGSTSGDIRHRSKLPDITLPKFSGEYSKWPSFKELFDSLIMANERLSDVERLHYLRGCMEGSPAQLIQTLPLTGDSLKVSMDMLIERYENKRLIIQAQLDKLFSITTPTQKDARSLSSMISTVSEATKALHSLGMEESMWDSIIVHHVSRHLDRATRELWEISLGASQDYPRFKQMEEFLIARARALERIEAAPSQSTSSTKPPVKKIMTAQQGTSQQSTPPSRSSTSYSCDCCGVNHFIVTCSKFRELSVADRRKLAVEKWLCFNCLGRHNVRSCKSTIGCKVYGTKHHTMLHDAAATDSTTSKPTTSSTAQATQ